MTWFSVVLALLVILVIVKMVRIVPQQMVYVVERLGRYHRMLEAGLHIVIPFVDNVRAKLSLKEIVLDIPEQLCITKDNVQVKIDGILFFRVTEAARAFYGVSNYVTAIVQLAQTTLRSEIGKIDLDRTFEEREHINNSVVLALDKATDSWGVKVLRYEIKSIEPPREVLDAMEKQMRAEREKRAKILESEGDRDSRINRAEGQKQEAIKASEAQKQRQINEAEGQASAIRAVADATGNALRMVAEALSSPGGAQAAQLRVAEEYVLQFGKLAQQATTMIVPANASELSSMLATAFALFGKTQVSPAADAEPRRPADERRPKSPD